MCAREVHGGNHVRRAVRRDGITAGRGLPRVDPSGTLGSCWLLAEEVRIPEIMQDVATTCAVRLSVAGSEERL
jgi:hypothetical protein